MVRHSLMPLLTIPACAQDSLRALPGPLPHGGWLSLQTPSIDLVLSPSPSIFQLFWELLHLRTRRLDVCIIHLRNMKVYLIIKNYGSSLFLST